MLRAYGVKTETGLDLAQPLRPTVLADDATALSQPLRPATIAGFASTTLPPAGTLACARFTPEGRGAWVVVHAVSGDIELLWQEDGEAQGRVFTVGGVGTTWTTVLGEPSIPLGQPVSARFDSGRWDANLAGVRLPQDEYSPDLWVPPGRRLCVVDLSLDANLSCVVYVQQPDARRAGGS